MGMDASKKCHHCGAEIGKLCKETCEVNGRKIRILKYALSDLELALDDIDLTRNMEKACHREPSHDGYEKDPDDCFRGSGARSQLCLR